MQTPADLDELRSIRDFLAGEAPLELEGGMPQPRSATTLRLDFLERVKELEAAGLLQPGELSLPQPIAPSPQAIVISSAHFTITYDTTGPNAVTNRIAKDALTDLEAGLTSFVSYFGIGVSTMTQVHFDSTGTHYTDPATGIHFKADGFRTSDNNRPARTQIAVHEDFHVWQFARGWALTSKVGEKLYWIMEGTAAWAALKWTASTPSLIGPSYLNYWFDHPDRVRLATGSTAAAGYVTLPFWMWTEQTYSGAMRTFLNGGMPSGSVVDALARAMDPSKSFEELACEFGCNLLNGGWCQSAYRRIVDIEQPITTLIPILTFLPSNDPAYTGQLTGEGSTWTSGGRLNAGVLYFYCVQFRLSNAAPSKAWRGVVSVDSLSGDGSVLAYFATGPSPSTTYSQGSVPMSLPYPTSIDVYVVSGGNQHPPNTKFSLDFTAQFVGT
jgi:hypothetical protein